MPTQKNRKHIGRKRSPCDQANGYRSRRPSYTLNSPDHTPIHWLSGTVVAAHA